MRNVCFGMGVVDTSGIRTCGETMKENERLS